MFDTHCHLNFKRFRKALDETIMQARAAGVSLIVVPGTDLISSKRAIDISNLYEGVYAAVGIHPHHAFEVLEKKLDVEDLLKQVEGLLSDEKVVAVGEVGLDKHMYEQTKYEEYRLSEDFIGIQSLLFRRQIELAKLHQKSLIIHNREASKELLEILDTSWSDTLRFKTVFHCCEPNFDLLKFAITHDIFIGIDGDITYDTEKYEFIKSVPDELLVLETDSPYLLPEPLKSKRAYPNVPANIEIIAKKVAEITSTNWKNLAAICEANGRNLFQINTHG